MLNGSLEAPLRIGNLELVHPLVLAPLAGISDLPFRLLAKEQGCGLVFTEMISAEGLTRNMKKTRKLLQTCPEERPLAIQIFGSRPEVLSGAAQIAEEWGADIVDINMGCPVRKVVGGGSGAALLKDLDRLEETIRAVRKSISIPLTIKIRSGWDEKNKNFLEVARMAQDLGVDALTIHGRTRTQGYGIPADWDVIARVREEVRIPVIGNGDLLSPQSILDFFGKTRCSGAMIGRGACGNPWLFRQSLNLLRGEPVNEPPLEEREATILRHLKMMVETRGEARGVREFRKHLIWYTRRLRGSVDFRSQVHLWQRAAEVSEKIKEYFQNLSIRPLFS